MLSVVNYWLKKQQSMAVVGTFLFAVRLFKLQTFFIYSKEEEDPPKLNFV